MSRCVAPNNGRAAAHAGPSVRTNWLADDRERGLGCAEHAENPGLVRAASQERRILHAPLRARRFGVEDKRPRSRVSRCDGWINTASRDTIVVGGFAPPACPPRHASLPTRNEERDHD